jgi:hypothetical protein
MSKLHEDFRTSVIITRSVPFTMRNVSAKILRENRNMYFTINNLFPKIGPCGKIYTDRQVTNENIVRRLRLDAR